MPCLKPRLAFNYNSENKDRHKTLPALKMGVPVTSRTNQMKTVVLQQHSELVAYQLASSSAGPQSTPKYIPTSPPTASGNKFHNVTVAGKARQLNGNMGFKEDATPSKHDYNNVHAKDESRQVNGDMTVEASQMFWG
ncbi:hypothetical protein FE257_006967 [Aspergillus nanangensis]|uniref:Uncharacterized protein n=1 Tax=Aspergillus nanangensis TaxID=2582783 RepID=A0AAD4CQH1_ASPNN|nr:hypothetical protein FE257_006967 [Aspergillus nanangensis]